MENPPVPSPLQQLQASSAAAPFLFSEEQLQAFEAEEARGEFTGERLLQRRPEAYHGIVRMAAEGLSIAATARAWGVSRNTVCAVREREGITIEHEKKELLRDLRRAARLSVERVIELIPHIQDAQKAAIVSAVAIDKLQLLSGEATSRIERVEVDQDALCKMLSAAPVIEVEAEITGPLGGAAGQRAAGAAGLPAGPGVAQSAAGAAVNTPTDSESDVSGGFPLCGDEMGATLGATSDRLAGDEASLASDLTGGEGVGFSSPPPYTPTGLGEEKFWGKGAPPSGVDGDDIP